MQLDERLTPRELGEMIYGNYRAVAAAAKRLLKIQRLKLELDDDELDEWEDIIATGDLEDVLEVLLRRI